MKSLRQTWNEMIELFSRKNEVLGEILLHVLLGQIFCDVKIKFGPELKDIRISSLIIQPSRSGKGQAVKVLKDVAEDLLVSLTKETVITDAGLIGSINQKTIEYNLKNKFSEDNPNYVDPVEKGDLFNYNIIVFDEAKQLLQQGKWSENMLSILQEALDTPGVVRKKLSSKLAIEYETKSVIVATTYYIKEMKEILLHQGFFQRILVYIRNINYRDRRMMREEILNSFNKNLGYQDYLELKRSFVDQIKKLKPRKVFVLNKQVLGLISNNMKEFEDYIIENFSGEELTNLMSFVFGLQETYIKLCCHYAIMRGHEEIISSDVLAAKFLVRTCIFSLMNELWAMAGVGDKSFDSNKILKFIKYSYKKSGLLCMNKGDLVSTIRKSSGLSKQKVLSAINRMINNNMLVVETGNKKEKLIKINEEI